MTTPLEQFKSTIVSIRDILRKEGITGMDSMKHCTLYITARYMSTERCARVGIPAKFAWETILETARKGGLHIQVSRDSIFNVGGVDCLVNHFDTLFKTTEFLFRIDAAGHAEIMEKLAPIELDIIHLETDILGWVYEQHLHKGSSSATRDLGQHFTDRSITHYMTNLCKPTRHEIICDPTMGTGGFLTSALYYLQRVERLTDAEICATKDKFHGFDIDQFLSSVASINMFVESHGTVFPNVVCRNSLEKGAIVSYDVILANMPFGLKGLTYARCHESVKALHIDGTKSEPLFLQWMMVNLNVGGRCAVVVPGGVLTTDSKCHTGTRKYLLDNFELKRVIQMNGKFFMNTGIQPSILFFEKTGKPTSVVDFWQVEKNADGTIREDLIISVPRTAIKEPYSFDMRRYQIATAAEHVADFPLVALEDLLVDHAVRSPIPTTSADGGCFNLYSSSRDVFKHSVAEFKENEYLLQGSRGTITNATHYCNTPFSASNNVFVLTLKDATVANLKYIYYTLKLSGIADKTAVTSIIPMLTKTMFRSIKILLPPLPVQEAIVHDLDLICQTADFAKRSVETVQQQMGAVIRSITARRFERTPLAEVCTHMNGKTLASSEKITAGAYDVMGGGMEYIGKTAAFNREGETISVSKSGASAGFVAYHNKKYWAGDCLTITPKDPSTLVIKFLYYYLKMNNHLITSKTSGTTIPHCKWDDIIDITIPIPPVSVQTEVLTMLDEMDAECKMLEQMAANAEERARFVLDGYLSAAPAAPAAPPPAPLAAVLTHEFDAATATRTQLLEECKRRNIQNVSTKKKEELLKMLEAVTS